MADVTTVLFDLDGTLCLPSRDREEVLAAAFDRAGVERYCSIEDVAAVVDEVPTAESEREFYELTLRAAAERVGADPDLAPPVAEAYVEVVDHANVEFRPGAERALDAVRDRYRIGLVTNGSEDNQRRKLTALGIEDAFAATAFAAPGEGVDPKPATDGFEAVLAILDADPDRTVHVGDSIAADVAGAHATGLGSVWVPTDDPDAADREGYDPEIVLDEIAALPEAL